MVLVMSVNPGFGGQSFIPSSLDKVATLRRLIDASGREIRLEIDGGIKVDNVAAAARAGADTFVAGSAVFGVPATATTRSGRLPSRHRRHAGRDLNGHTRASLPGLPVRPRRHPRRHGPGPHARAEPRARRSTLAAGGRST